MDSLTPLDACLEQALRDLPEVAAEPCPLSDAVGAILAEDLCFPADMPPVAEALRGGLAVAALDLTGASASLPVFLGAGHPVLPGDPLPGGADAVLPQDGAEAVPGGWEAIRPIGPGEGVRRAGHDGRAGTVILPAGAPLTDKARFVAAKAGTTRCTIRRPRVAIALPDPDQAAFARAFLNRLGAAIGDDAPHLILRPAKDAQPRLALSPAQTAWLVRAGSALELSVPQRFDGMLTALFALGLPAMAALTGARPVTQDRPLARKVASALGMAELVLLTRQDGDWNPAQAGMVTLATLAAAEACAILPPETEGFGAGAVLSGIPLVAPFG